MIADKDHECAVRPANLRKRIDFAVDTLKGEIPGLPADRMGCVQYHQTFSTVEAPPNKDRFASLQNFTRPRSPRNSRSPRLVGPSRHASLKGDFHERSNISLTHDDVRSSAAG